jgi:hypothetical protein
MWQDYVYSGVSLAFTYSLIPQIIKGYKDKRQDISLQTSGITSLGLYTLAYTAHTLDLDYSALTNLATGTMWATILGQRLFYKQKNLENIIEEK